MVAAEYQRVVAVVKDAKLTGRPHGLIQPLCYEDGSLIPDLREAFPTAGEIFVPRNYHELPDSLILVDYERNQRPSFTVRNPSDYILSDWEQLDHSLCDMLEVETFPPVGSKIWAPYRPSSYYFLQEKKTGAVRGPFKIGQGGKVDYSYDGCEVPVALLTPDDEPVTLFKLLEERFVFHIPAQKVPTSAIISISGLQDLNMTYDQRPLVRTSVLVELVRSKPEAFLVDLMSPEDTLAWVRPLLKEHLGVDTSQLEQFKQLLVGLRALPVARGLPPTLLETRLARAEGRLEDATALLQVLSGSEERLVERFLDTSSGKQVLERFIQTKRPEFLEAVRKEVRREVEDLERMRDETQRSVAALVVERDEIQADIERRRAQSSTEQRQELTGELEGLQRQIRELRDEVGYVERKKRDLDHDVLLLETRAGEHELQLRERLLELAPFISVVTGAPSRKAAPLGYGINVPMLEGSPATPREVIEKVREYFRAAGREFSLSEVANLLVSILQNRFTILAGLPGVGKSSTADLLGRALGLRPGGDPRRMIKVNVGRGWVSSRDLIGTFNPLSGEFDPADSGLYHGLLAHDSEERTGGAALPLWVLLEEMNLSPVEHYLSDFMPQADEEQTHGFLTCGGRQLNFGRALRFIGTVNYDETTESLSQRLLSRANVIYLEAPQARGMHSIGEKPPEMPTGAISLEVLRPLWDASAVLEEEEAFVLGKVTDWLEREEDGGKSLGRRLVIPPRLRNAIGRYCSASGSFIRGERGELGALDLAVAQRIIPHCRGTGDGYRRRLEGFRAICEEEHLLTSARLLGRMLASGNHYQEYDFFQFS